MSENDYSVEEGVTEGQDQVKPASQKTTVEWTSMLENFKIPNNLPGKLLDGCKVRVQIVDVVCVFTCCTVVFVWLQ